MAAPTALDLLWGTRDRPRRGPRPSLSLDRIVAEAIALADAEGLASLSMQHLAERLGCAKMALYRYVPGKSELVALMVDAALGDPPEAPPQTAQAGRTTRSAQTRTPGEQQWRTVLRLWATTIDARYRLHPWAIDATAGARPTGPHEMAWMETALAALAGTGLTGPERLDAVALLNGHVRSLVQVTRPASTISRRRWPARSARPWPPTPTATRRSWRPSRNRHRPPGATTPSTSASTASSTASPPSSPPARPRLDEQEDHRRPTWQVQKN